MATRMEGGCRKVVSLTPGCCKTGRICLDNPSNQKATSLFRFRTTQTQNKEKSDGKSF
jgi:hypothetical protein